MILTLLRFICISFKRCPRSYIGIRVILCCNIEAFLAVVICSTSISSASEIGSVLNNNPLCIRTGRTSSYICIRSVLSY